MNKISFTLVVLLITTAIAQENISVPILSIPPSPKLNAMAGVGVALPTTDPFGQYSNPAQVGYASRFTNFSLHFYPGTLRPDPGSQTEFRSSAVNLGYRMRNRSRESSFSFGIGYINSDLNLGEVIYTDSTGNILQRSINNETYYSIAFGLSFASTDQYTSNT